MNAHLRWTVLVELSTRIDHALIPSCHGEDRQTLLECCTDIYTRVVEQYIHPTCTTGEVCSRREFADCAYEPSVCEMNAEWK